MSHLRVDDSDGIATVCMSRGKVNALHAEMVEELRSTFGALAGRDDVSGVILTGSGAFFSFGFDVPGLYDLTPEAFAGFLRSFTALYTELFLFPKPLVAAVNGHASAGGCILALACDARIMVKDRGRIGLNEVAFGSSLFAGSVHMLRFAVGDAVASRVALSGTLFDGGEAARFGLVDQLVPAGELPAVARALALGLGHGQPAAFRSIKTLLRAPLAERMRAAEPASIKEFVEIWYSPSTRAELRKIQIRQ